MSTIVPAIIPVSHQSIIDDCARLHFAAEIHLDVVDGNFVPAVSWPYQPAGDPLEVKSALKAFSLEVDLMVHSPLPAAAAWLQAGAEMLVFHVETLTVDELAEFDRQHNCTIGIAANNDTPFATLIPYLPYADYVQVMGIATIGSQGQPFDVRAIDRLHALTSDYPSIMSSVDGSVNEQTISDLQVAGSERFIVGSAIVGAADPLVAYQALQELLQ